MGGQQACTAAAAAFSRLFSAAGEGVVAAAAAAASSSTGKHAQQARPSPCAMLPRSHTAAAAAAAAAAPAGGAPAASSDAPKRQAAKQKQPADKQQGPTLGLATAADQALLALSFEQVHAAMQQELALHHAHGERVRPRSVLLVCNDSYSAPHRTAQHSAAAACCH